MSPGKLESGFETIQSEEEDRESAPATYSIAPYPADFTLEVLVSKIDNGSIIIPEFQRRFVWTIRQSSRLIESFLLGLPVPAVFLYVEPARGRLLVVDGQQRINSVVYFFQGLFGLETKGRRVVFKLEGLNPGSPYAGKTYEALRDSNEEAWRRLNDSVLRSIIIKQLKPNDHTSVFHIFERLNTGGTHLVGQEIRNCVYLGTFNARLKKLNVLSDWRQVLARPREDKRLRDVELILRFLALLDDSKRYRKPMKDFLNQFMSLHQNDNEAALQRYEDLFKRTTTAILTHLGDRPFHRKAGINVAIFDAVYTAFARHLDGIPADIQRRYTALRANREFDQCVTSSTTDEAVVKKRLALAAKMLFGG